MSDADVRWPGIYCTCTEAGPQPPGDGVYIGDSGRWRNPYATEWGRSARQTIVDAFRDFALGHLREEPAWLDPLIDWERNQPWPLLCACQPPDCHACVLVALCWRLIEQRTGVVPPAEADRLAASWLREPASTRVRDALRRTLLRRYDGRVQLISEFQIPAGGRADLVALTEDHLEAWEIKGARDVLARLPRQIAGYGTVFDRCTAVVAPRHVERAEAMLPPWWGLIAFEIGETVSMTALRHAEPNPCIQAPDLFRLLWKEEAKEVALLLGAGGRRGWRPQQLDRWLADHTSVEEAEIIVRWTLASRNPHQAAFDSERYRRARAEARPAIFAGTLAETLAAALGERLPLLMPSDATLPFAAEDTRG